MTIFYESPIAKRLLAKGTKTTIMLFGQVHTKLKALTERVRRHEWIHVQQYIETTALGVILWGILAAVVSPWLLIAIPFTYYLLYLGECLVSIIYHAIKRDLEQKLFDAAYRFSAMEQEAYDNQDNKMYFKERRWFAFCKYYGTV